MVEQANGPAVPDSPSVPKRQPTFDRAAVSGCAVGAAVPILLIVALLITSNCPGDKPSQEVHEAASELRPGTPATTRRSPAEIYSDFEKKVAAKEPMDAVTVGADLLRYYSSSPEATKVREKLPTLYIEIAAESKAKAELKEKERLINVWTYGSFEDSMSGKDNRLATIDSANLVSFAFPYHGPQRANLKLRRHPRFGLDVILSIEKGQIECNSSSGCSALVKFDDGAAIRWKGLESSDHDPTVVFLQDESEFIRKLRSSKLLRIELTIYREGLQEFDFEVGGFDYSRFAAGQ